VNHNEDTTVTVQPNSLYVKEKQIIIALVISLGPEFYMKQ